jgi:hypothetical protein
MISRDASQKVFKFVTTRVKRNLAVTALMNLGFKACTPPPSLLRPLTIVCSRKAESGLDFIQPP